MSQDGQTVYIDKRLPQTLTTKSGKDFNPHAFISHHERTEFPLMKKRGMKYAQAHKRATAAEKKLVEAHGMDFGEYSDALKPYIDQARNHSSDIPDDLDSQPYDDSGESHLLKRDEEDETPDEELLERIRSRFKYAQDAWNADRQRYRDDLLFASGEHWPATIQRDREAQGRPCLVVDKLNQYARQIVNDSRQNRPGIKVRPVDSDADPETAEIIQGLTRHIEERSSADFAYDTALECAVKGGFGYWRILTEYQHENTFDQEISIKRIRNPLTVYPDPDIQEPDGSDMKDCFLVEDIDREEFEKEYTEAALIDFEADSGKFGDWIGKKVRVAEYYYLENEDRNLHLLGDGTTTTDEELKAAKDAGINPPPIKETRKIPVSRVKWCKTNGVEILEGPKSVAGKWIPVVPVWGNEEDIDGELIHTGMIHNAKGAQQLYDYSRSAFAERVALTPKAPYIAAAGQVEDYEQEWNTANTINHSVLRYNPIDVNGVQVPPPIRQQASDIPAGFAEDMRLSEHDIQASIGMYEASLGQKSNEKSGKAIMARERSGDVATFHYHDNLSRAIRHSGRIIVDLIPKIYDTKRILRIIGSDGQAKMVQTDPSQPKAVQKSGTSSVFNIGVGIYDVAVASGPSYTTSRQEAADAMMQMTQSDPKLWQTHGDLITKSMDWPMAEEFSKRFELMLPPQLKPQPNMTPEIQAVVTPLKQQMDQMNQALQHGHQLIQAQQQKIQELESEQATKSSELLIKARDVEVKAYVAETQRMIGLQPAMGKEDVQQLIHQTLIDIANTPPDVKQPEPQQQPTPHPSQDQPQTGQVPQGEPA